MTEFNPDLHENHVELVGHYGGDLTHALSAWTSTTRHLTQEKIDRLPVLLHMLADNNHGTPFEKSSLHFLVTADIASHIHAIKHRIGVSVNGESARYRELNDKYYIPTDWPETERVKLMMHCTESFRRYHETIDALMEAGLTRKRAKESARFYLPYANQLHFDVMFNFRSFVHFCYLRADDHAQFEIRVIAKEMIRLVMAIPGNPFKESINAFALDKRV